MKKDRLLELAGVQLNEEAPHVEYRRAIKELARIIIEIASEEANDQDEYMNEVESSVDDALDDLKEMIKDLQ